MLSKIDTWAVIDRIVKEEGCELFDLEYPAGQKGALRVFLMRKAQGSSAEMSAHVRVEDCAKVSRRILSLENIEELLPGKVVLEVSSPGVNRKLRRPEHFEGAIGERVKVIFNADVTQATHSERARKSGVVVGTLLSFDGSKVAVRDEGSDDLVDVPLGEIREARVDFLFT